MIVIFAACGLVVVGALFLFNDVFYGLAGTLHYGSHNLFPFPVALALIVVGVALFAGTIAVDRRFGSGRSGK